MRKEVEQHAQRMELDLIANDDKEHWSTLSLHILDDHAKKHMRKLTDAVCKNDFKAIMEISPKISNYLMMLEDNAYNKINNRVNK